MRSIWITGAVLLGLAVQGCSPTRPAQVRSYWGTTLERAPLHAAYQWAGVETDPAAFVPDAHLHTLVRGNIERGLAEMGYRPVQGDNPPDFLISYRLGTGVQPTAAGPSQMGLLTIETHSADGRLLWRGWAEGVIDPSLPPEIRRAWLEETIQRVLAEFAPAEPCR